ncbi:MAG: electron transport complex protein RnfA [Oscillospiraceae bacterium]
MADLEVTKNVFTILVSAILVDNFVLSQFLGICPFLGVSKKLDSALGMGVAVTFVMVLATAVTWPLYYYVLTPNFQYLNNVSFILVIAALVQLIEVVLKRKLPPLYHSLGIYLPLITTNCAVLGVTILNLDENYNFWQSLLNSFGAGLGFLLALVVFSGVRMRMEDSRASRSFEGVPITLVAASIVSMAFMGFGGIV